ncbi:MAG TPA: triose-phosphate isomerase [Gemmatirosa sp.]
MLKPIFAANWKMNHGPTDARAFMRSFLSQAPRGDGRTIVFFPPAITLGTVVDALHERPEILIGVQNVHEEAAGAYTGEISAGMARDAGARLVLVGHSERRHVFGETDAQTAKKCELVTRAGLIPMLCVGETLSEREAGLTEQVVVRQLTAAIAGLDNAHIGSMLVAYEPVWAIGTGRNATADDAATVHAAIRAALRERVGQHAAVMPILYGGSVNRGNARLLLGARNVDGLLVGGASLDPGNWAAIVQD